MTPPRAHGLTCAPCVRYPYPNSGGYIGYIDYIIDLYSDVIAIQAKSDFRPLFS